MPATLSTSLRLLSQQEFGIIAFEVMKEVFAIHNEFGRFFDERIYKRELALRMPGIVLEMPLDVRFRSFTRRYFLDVVVDNAAIFEFKSVERLVPRHFSQLTNYLNLAQAPHGKLINTRRESVEHEFVNIQYSLAQRQAFTVDVKRWSQAISGALDFEHIIIDLLRDLGTGLDVGLYEEAVMQFFGRNPPLYNEVNVFSHDKCVGTQPMRCITETCAFKITAFTDDQPNFEVHAQRLLNHTELETLFWLNVAPEKITFTTLSASIP